MAYIAQPSDLIPCPLAPSPSLLPRAATRTRSCAWRRRLASPDACRPAPPFAARRRLLHHGLASSCSTAPLPRAPPLLLLRRPNCPAGLSIPSSRRRPLLSSDCKPPPAPFPLTPRLPTAPARRPPRRPTRHPGELSTGLRRCVASPTPLCPTAVVRPARRGFPPATAAPGAASLASFPPRPWPGPAAAGSSGRRACAPVDPLWPDNVRPGWGVPGHSPAPVVKLPGQMSSESVSKWTCELLKKKDIKNK
jgi:hypothetical protein